MSVQGKNSLSYKKKSVKESNTPHVGVKTLTFGHEFLNAGETFIPFDSLNLPAAFAQSGLSNPSSQSLLAAQLQAFKQNVTVVSSARGIIQKSEYLVKNSGIYFKNIESLANEVFEVEVADIMVSGNRVVDMRKIRIEGELLDSTTDFALGYSVDVYSEEIIVFRDGLQMFRSDDNDDSGTTGNYYYVNVDYNGRSSVIRFFEPAVDDEAIMIVSTGGIVDSPNVSTFQQIETLAGQIDNLVPTVAALAGVPETNFRSAPNNVDLQAFGQTVMFVEESSYGYKNSSVDFTIDLNKNINFISTSADLSIFFSNSINGKSTTLILENTSLSNINLTIPSTDFNPPTVLVISDTNNVFNVYWANNKAYITQQ